MKAQMRRLLWAVASMLFAAAMLVGPAQAERPDDRAGLLGVGSASAAAIGDQAVRPDDRGGSLGVGGAGGSSLTQATRPDDRSGRIGVGSAETWVARTAIRPDDRDGIRGLGMTQAATTPVAASAGDPFEWGDAFLGAGATVGLLLLGASLVFTVRSKGRVILH